MHDDAPTVGPCPLCTSAPRQYHPTTARRYLQIGLTIDPERVDTGIWCEACSLPSVVQIVLVQVCRHGWPLRDFATVATCDECGSMTRHRHLG